MKHLSTPAILLALFAAAGLILSTSPASAAPTFHYDYEAGMNAAKSAKKPAVVVFSASWCPPCQQMKNHVYPSTEVSPYHDDFVWIYLDVDQPENQMIASQHRVGPIPHIAFKNSMGKSVHNLKGGLPPQQFAKVLSDVQAKTTTEKPPVTQQATQEKKKKWSLFDFFRRNPA